MSNKIEQAYKEFFKNYYLNMSEKEKEVFYQEINEILKEEETKTIKHIKEYYERRN